MRTQEVEEEEAHDSSDDDIGVDPHDDIDVSDADEANGGEEGREDNVDPIVDKFFRVYILPLAIEFFKPVLVFIVKVILDKFTDLSPGSSSTYIRCRLCKGTSIVPFICVNTIKLWCRYFLGIFLTECLISLAFCGIVGPRRGEVSS